MSAGRIARHRNYGEILMRHERDQKIKRFMKLITYFLLAAFLLIVFFIISRWEKREVQKEDQKQSTSFVIYQQEVLHQ
jgi:hypothetical protein